MNFRKTIILIPALFFISACAQIDTPKLDKNQGLSGGLPRVPDRAKVWREPLTDMQFVWAAGECFEMGQTDTEMDDILKAAGEKKYESWYGDELPLHRVCVAGFWVGKAEVTRGQFRRFAEATGYETEAEKQGFSLIWRGEWMAQQGYNWRMADFDLDSRHPVLHVSWNDAKAMARWLSEQNGVLFRLPTEAEWEYACRAGTKTIRFWGDAPSEACNYANIADRKAQIRFMDLTIHNCDDGYIYTSPVSSFHPNRFGLYDMLGNVWEWCEDRYDPNYYDKSPKNNPKGPSNGSYRVMRGGFWGSEPSDLRCANRSREAPQGRSDTYGFRLVIVPSQ